MTEASDIENLLRKHEAFEDAKLRRLVARGGWLKAGIVGAFSLLLWAFNLGKAEADYVKRPELAKALADNTAALDRVTAALQTHSERITALETEMRIRNQSISPAPLRVTP